MFKISTKLFGKKDRNRTKTVGQKLGIDLDEEIKKFMANGGTLEREIFFLFWEAMNEDEEALAKYLEKLLDELLSFLQNNKKTPFSPQVYVNTITFLTLQHELPVNAQTTKFITELMHKWNKNRQKYGTPLDLPSANDIFSVLYKRLIENDNAIDSLVIQCYQLHSHDELQKIADYYQNPTIVHVLNGYNNIGSLSGDKVCIWPYLKHLYLDTPDLNKPILSTSVSKFRQITGQIYLLPKLAENSLLALIFMINQLISYSRIPDESIIDHAMTVLKRFYLWPVPYGTEARDLLLKLKREKLAPGISFLQRIWKESRIIEIISTGNEEANEPQCNRPIYYLMDNNDNKSLIMGNILKIDVGWDNNYVIRTGVSSKTCGLILLNLLCYENDVNYNQQILSCIKKLNENEILSFYKQIVNIYIQSSESNDKIAKPSRIEAFKVLAKEIIQHCKEKEKMQNNDDVFAELNDITLEFLPTLPLIQHIQLLCDLTKDEFPTKGQIASSEVFYPINDVLNKIRNILNNLMSVATDEDPVTVRLAIAGNNIILNACITAYATLKRHGSDLLSKFNLEFYLLPYNTNHLADWLARQDSWYNRHVYVPLQAPLFLAPGCDLKTKPKSRMTGNLCSITEFYRDITESYARESEHEVPIMVWELQAWKDEPFTNTPDQVIPFCLRVVLGIEAEYNGQQVLVRRDTDNEFKEESTSGNNTSLNSSVNGSTISSPNQQSQSQPPSITATTSIGSNGPVISSPSIRDNNNSLNDLDGENKNDEDLELKNDNYGNFGYVPVPLNLEYVPVDMIGKTLERRALKDQSYNYLTICTCPKYDDKGFPPTPCKEFVAELHTENYNNTVKRRKGNEVDSLHIANIIIQTNQLEDRFWTMVDDRVYGPFARIKITPMVDLITNRQVFMPIRTFFPVNLS